MKKRFYAVILSLLMMFSIVMPVSAESGVVYINDDMGVLEDTFSDLNTKAGEISDYYGINVSMYLAASTSDYDSVYEATEDLYDETFGNDDGFMMTFCEEEGSWTLYKNGEAEDILDEDDEDSLWDAYDNEEYYGQGVQRYLMKADTLLSDYTGLQPYLAGDATGTASKGFDVTSEDDDYEAVLPRLVDEAELLSDSEAEDLVDKLNEISERQKVDVVIVTKNSFGDLSPMEFADDYYDYNGFGYGPNHNGIVLAVDMGERNWWMSTTGSGIQIFTDAGQDYMKEQFLPYLSDGDYMDCFTTFADLCDQFITQAYDDEPYDVGNLPKSPLSILWIPGAIVIGFVTAFIMASSKKAKMKTVRAQPEAGEYVREGSMQLVTNYDQYVTSRTTSRRIETSSSSGGGGSSTHTSSSGTSHGGSGGSF